MDELNAFKLDQALGFHVNRAAYLMTEEIGKRFVEAGFPITAQDFGILIRLLNEGAITQARIGQLMMRDKTTITRRLDGLVKKNLVERVENLEDRRCFNIQLTDKGRETLETVFPMASRFQHELLEGISNDEKTVVIKVLKHITDTLICLKS